MFCLLFGGSCGHLHFWGAALSKFALVCSTSPLLVSSSLSGFSPWGVLCLEPLGFLGATTCCLRDLGEGLAHPCCLLGFAWVQAVNGLCEVLDPCGFLFGLGCVCV